MKVSPERHSKFSGTAEPGLGIDIASYMSSYSASTSPDNTHHLSPQTPTDKAYSPAVGYERRSKYDKRSRTSESLSVYSPMSRARTDPMTERLIQHRATKAAEWRIHWQTPTLMIISFITAMLFAFGQHLLYRSLHHTSEPNEDKRVRVVLYGRALAYSSKVAFGGCMILIYRQRMWTTFREKALSIFAIDRIFLAEEDPSLFLNLEVWQNAFVVTIMAIIIWLIPIATIVFSPAALTFGDILETGNANLFVPNLNLSSEAYKDWRNPILMPDGTRRRSLVFYNTTDIAGTAPGYFDYYDQPSADLNRISLMTAYSIKDQPLNRDDARQFSCGGDFNCTYTISFIAPGYKCEEIGKSADDDQKLADAGAPFNTSVLSPRGPHAYIADVDTGEYARPQAAALSNQGGVPIGTPPADLGFLKSEPVVWIGYSTNSSEKLPSDSPYSLNWTYRYDPHIFACTHYEANYTIAYNYSGPWFATNVSYTWIKPIIDTNFSRNADGTWNTSAPYPASNFVSPRVDPIAYKKTVAYHALGQRLRNFLRGTVELEAPKPGPSYARVYSEITMTRLVSNSSSTPLKDLPVRLQSLYADMILSLFSAPQMLVVSQERVLVSTSHYKSTFIYSPGKLWVCYGPVFFVVFLCLLGGMYTIWHEGTTFSVGFSRIMVTTRNETLDDISRGACLGNDPFPEELMRTRLRFGVLNEPDNGATDYNGQAGLEEWRGAGHCAFGVPAEVGSIRKGVPYAGLQPRRESKMMVMEKEKTD